MKLFIRSTGAISPQHSLVKERFFSHRMEPSADYFKCQEPAYEEFVDVKMIRRMSRIVKMGVAAAMTCLQNAGVQKPAAILTATAYGCLEDTSSFLRRMIEFEEKMLSPTAFIQSTHNTVGAQIALLLKCHQYNNTIVHRAFSFENAITETALLISEGMGPVLVGSVDEITDDRHQILSRFGLYRKQNGQGKIAGEGASFFLVDRLPGTQSPVIIRDLQTLYRPENITDIKKTIQDLMERNGLRTEDLNLVLTSHSGSPEQDRDDDALLNSVFKGLPHFPFKSLCGDYPTAAGFAVWLAATLIRDQQIPAWMKTIPLPLKTILIHQHDDSAHHSFFIISSIE